MAGPPDTGGAGRIAFDGLSAWYGSFRAVRDVTLTIRPQAITALIGPSGCGKSTLIRTINRMHETIRGARIEGRLTLDDVDIYGAGIEAPRVRRLVGMVFQKPNPFPSMTIFENVAAGVRLAGIGRREELSAIVQRSLEQAGLWDEVRDKLHAPGTSLSGGQQQRLCIARAIATQPEILLLDEPCSALDPVSTERIEALLGVLRHRYTIVIVTHNLGQAQRIADDTAFLSADADGAGRVVEAGPTATIFGEPREDLTRAYVRGEFG